MTTQTSQSLGSPGTVSDMPPTGTGTETSASVRERADQVGGAAKDEAAGIAQEVKYQARDLVGEARNQARQQLDTQKSRLGDLLREISDELDQMADNSKQSGLATGIVREIAARARDARGYLGGGGDVVEDVRQFARRRPGAFLLGAVAAGVLAGRTTRAAAAARRQQQAPRDGYYGPGETPGDAWTGHGQTSTAPASGFSGAGYGYPAGAPATEQYATGTGSTTDPSAPQYPGTVRPGGEERA